MYALTLSLNDVPMIITIDVRNKICKLRSSRTISGLALFKSASPMSIKNAVHSLFLNYRQLIMAQ